MYSSIFKDCIGSKGIVHCDKNSYVLPVYYSKQCDQSDININAPADLFDQIIRNRLCRLCDIQNSKHICKTTSNYNGRIVWNKKRGCQNNRNEDSILGRAKKII